MFLVAYGNHFRNPFHFDDDHAIVNNPSVRSLKSIPRFFVDATTFSVLPLNQTYRPVTQTTFAVDDRIGGGDPLVFQIDTFIWFVLLLVALFALVDALTGSSAQALVATAVFGLHPAMADTVNYVVQRGEILAALGVVSGLALYVRRPASRRTGVFLVPVLAGLLAKQTAAAFPLLLAAFVWIDGRRVWTRDVVVSFIVTVAASAWIVSRTPATAAYASPTPILYLLTQPFVALRYFATFALPVSLSVDPGWAVVGGVRDPALWTGLAFVAAWLAMVWHLRRLASTRVAAFGLAWFLIAQLPAALVPLTEVGNSWRMFLPFIGLAIAAVSTAAVVLTSARARVVAVAVVLGAEAIGVHARNEVWRTDEALWRDATTKNPENPRAWMNYGVALIARGDYAGAVDACERALVIEPNYMLLHVNLGVAYGGSGRRADAEREFLTAQRMAPDDWRTHLYYAQWLDREQRAGEARRERDRARELNPAAADGVR